MQQLWDTIFSLECENFDAFLEFFTQLQSGIHRLKELGSPSVNDEMFFRAFVASKVRVKELQPSIAKHILDFSVPFQTSFSALGDAYTIESNKRKIHQDRPGTLVSSHGANNSQKMKKEGTATYSKRKRRRR